MHRKIITIFFLFLFALSLCYSSGKKDIDDRIVITINTPILLDSLEKLIENTYENVDFQYEFNDDTSIENTMEELLKKGNAPDFVVFESDADSFVQQYFLDLGSQSFVSRYSNTMIQNISYNGKVYFLPFAGNYLGYLLNYTLWKEAGLDLPKNDQQLLAGLEFCQQNGIGIDPYNTNHVFSNYGIKDIDIGRFLLCRVIPDFFCTYEGVKFANPLDGKLKKIPDSLKQELKNNDKWIHSPIYHISNMDDQNNAVPIIELASQGNMVAAFCSSIDYFKIQNLNKKLAQKHQEEEYEYVFLPILSSEENKPRYNAFAKYYIGLNKEVVLDKEKMKAGLEILDLISTDEGQEALMHDIYEGCFSFLDDYNGDLLNLDSLNNKLNIDVDNVYYQTMNFAEIEHFGHDLRIFYNGYYSFNDAIEDIDAYISDPDNHTFVDNEVIGKANDDFIYQNYNVRLEETKLGNLCATAIRDKINADFAFINGGALRSSIFEGPVTKNTIKLVTPYSDALLLLEVKGKKIKEVLEHSISGIYESRIPSGGFLQVSGIRFSFESDENLKKSTLIDCKTEDGDPIEDDKLYKIVIPSYLCGIKGYSIGGDGYYMLNLYDTNFSLSDVVLLKNTGYSLYDCLVSYFEDKVDLGINSIMDNRIDKIVK